jgi:nanoRNase/pAp phosphatase (c-di-AMP/oligoRNAs hydrolase)
MMRTYAFNGDADGLCALQQLRLAGVPAEQEAAVLVTGVKRDIALVERVKGSAGDACTVLDVSFDLNRSAVAALLAAGASVRYFDHHFAGEVPEHERLELHIDPSPTLCTSLIVDRYLAGRCRAWAAVGAYGDSLVDEGRLAAEAAGLDAAAAAQLQQLGLAVNYNAYGESIADLHVPPGELAQEMFPFGHPLDFVATSPTFRRLADGFREDMALAHQLRPLRQAPGAILFVLPDAPWARRASGTLANDLAKAHPGSAVAIVSHKSSGDYLVSLRVPRDAAVSAESFCRRFPTGGGRRTAAGINHLPSSELDVFAAAFEVQFRTP